MVRPVPSLLEAKLGQWVNEPPTGWWTCAWDGGMRGGEIVAEEAPETVAGVERSYTGRYLASMLAKRGAGAETVE